MTLAGRRKCRDGQGSGLSPAGEATLLNFRNDNGLIPPYQARQLIEMMDKYQDEKDAYSVFTEEWWMRYAYPPYGVEVCCNCS